MPATIRDVARHAGVSIATVSRVMRESKDVRPDTRERVMAAATDLSYTPSQLGRQLAERRHAANGIVFPDLSGPYFAEVVLGYEAVAAELRRSVLILSTNGRDDAETAVRAMAGRCDGLVVLGRTVTDDVVEAIAARGTPLVLIARPPIGELDSVNAENTTSAVALTHHLLEQGVRRLTFVGDPDASPDVARALAGDLGGRRPVRARRRHRAGHRLRPRRGRGRRHRRPRRSSATTCPTRSPARTTSSPSDSWAGCAPPESTCPAPSRSPAGTT